MKKIILLWFWLSGIAVPLCAQEEMEITGNNETDSVLILPDDPILEALDDLVKLSYFEKSNFVIDTYKLNVYNFPADSIPWYDDKVFADRLAKLDAQTPFILSYNDKVKAFINLYAVRKKELTSRILGLSYLYFPMFEAELDRFDLPLEFKYLAVVESALNPMVKSKAGAMGLWQFMYHTGKLYHLNVTSYVDDRRDPYKSTTAACHYFKFLYNIYGNWELVLAAYNCGPGNVNKAIRRSGGKKDYWDIYPYLPKETRGYVPAFIAVNYVMNYAAEHNLYPVKPKIISHEIDTVHIERQLSFEQISSTLGISVEDIEYLNPCYKKRVIPYSGNPQALCLPKDKVGIFLNNEQLIYTYLKAREDSAGSGLIEEEVRKVHIVKKGENIGSVAIKYDCTVADIKDWNGLRSARLRPGQKLTIFVLEEPHHKAGTTVQETKVEMKAGDQKYIYYTIQQGDTLWNIAKNNGVTLSKLKELNTNIDHNQLKPGTKIIIGIGG